jgi:uncharacterized membrane protein
MSYTAIGMAAGTALAWAALVYGFWGFLLMAVFLLIGGLLGRVAEGKLDLRSVRDALTGRRSSS